MALTGTGHTTATGNALANRLTGNAGNNRLIGGAADDMLTGGEPFVFSGNFGPDRITDIDLASANAFVAILSCLVEEGPVEASLQDRPDRCDGACADRQTAPTGGVEAGGLKAPGQGQDADAGAEALFRMRPVGHHRFTERRDRGAEFRRGGHPLAGPGGGRKRVWGAVRGSALPGIWLDTGCRPPAVPVNQSQR